ncbi:hypothetical protein [Membranihabitans marinus]|uniref:hypothetical protein n=1 Tax=Membranihabitans marinus TaxID=1227546 RepID=UPI001F2E81C9|nr:hypothetical protein [Membranihabitans marinus]
MKPLESSYLERLNQLKTLVQESKELETYLESEEESDYKILADIFEPQIQDLYNDVASDQPLQLVSLEIELLDEGFEGLFLPRILGYTVLRGGLTEHVKYIRPQEQFKRVLSTICDSVHFDYIKNRIGQTVQMGFALNSDIWTTAFINEISNKRVVNYLRSMKSQKLWLENDRSIAYNKYKRQFDEHNFYTVDFPENEIELKASYGQFINFLKFRIQKDLDNASILEDLILLIEDKNVQGNQEYSDILGLCMHFVKFDDKQNLRLSKVVNDIRKNDEASYLEYHFSFIERLLKSDIKVSPESYGKVYQLLSDQIKDDMLAFYYVMSVINDNGLAGEESIEQVKLAYNSHEGLSDFNESIRLSIYNYFHEELKTLLPSSYPEYFELSKLMSIYIYLFDNQLFSQNLKDSCYTYLQKCLKLYTDKRGKDYQEIKKFVVHQFQASFNMSEKEVLEIFKTRKRKKPTSL